MDFFRCVIHLHSNCNIYFYFLDIKTLNLIIRMKITVHTRKSIVKQTDQRMPKWFEEN